MVHLPETVSVCNMGRQNKNNENMAHSDFKLIKRAKEQNFLLQPKLIFKRCILIIHTYTKQTNF